MTEMKTKAQEVLYAYMDVEKDLSQPKILNDPNDELIENVLKWTDKVLDGIDLNEELPDD